MTGGSGPEVKADGGPAAGRGEAALPVAAARARLLSMLAPVVDVECAPLAGLPGRVLGETLVAQIDVPGADQSAMDGYAVRAADLEGGRRLRRVGTAHAGHPWGGRLGHGEAVRILTGADLPEGADTVVVQEHVDAGDAGVIVVDPIPEAGANIRRAGEDLARGSTVLEKGTLLRAAEVGLVAALGRTGAAVLRRPRVAVLATGDELVAAGGTLSPGMRHDSNGPTIRAMLWRLGVEAIDLGRAPDDPAVLEHRLRDAAVDADAIISSGGVSVGDADHVVAALQRAGELAFWKIAMRPGRPLAVGRIGRCWFFGLPGNPVSVMATFHQIVQPALQKLMGLAPRTPLSLKARLQGSLRKRPGRMEFQRGILDHDRDGGLLVRSSGPQGSGRLSSMRDADCFIVLDESAGDQAPGTIVTVQPFPGFVW